ncbi:TonB-dependent receptor [Pedobacter sp. L105]|uniref:TonB-dependent receptor n=1 Tax=Pedobacter sp. L105 TaxID=1641871 RepID=UPI0020B178BB|nr:TonB-dependent receptor [Pedobacter sp. L105]
MKLTAVLFIAAIMQVSASGFAQVTFKKQDVSLEQLFKEIRKQTGYNVLWSALSLKRSGLINADFKSTPLQEVLKKSLAGQNLSFTIENNTILIRCLKEEYKEKQKDIVVRGVVKDEKGIPLLGAGVRVKGTLNSTSTDNNGAFSITVADEKTVLIFSYVGYDPVEMVVGTQKTITLQLKPTGGQLEEVAVVAYGTQKKESLVGAQSSVNAADLNQPTANISSMLAGRIAGVVAVTRNGEPGSDQADVWIRGISNIGGDRNPLIVVDGVPNRPIDGLSPQDIESFTVLKDASATAVYGIRGANGVILVNTKKGKVGKPTISLNYYEGITRLTKTPDLIDGVEYMKLANEATATEAIRQGKTYTPLYSDDIINKTASGADPYVYPNVDWLSTLFKNFGQSRTMTTNLSGGVSNARYFVSLGYYDETGLFKTDDSQNYDGSQKYSRYNITTNLDWDLTPTTKMSLGIKGVLAQGRYPGANNAQDIFAQAFEISPVEFPKMYPNGYVPGISAQGDQRNPYADLTTRGYRTNYTNQLYSNLRLTQDLSFLTKGLAATAMYSFDATNSNEVDRTRRESTYYVSPNNPYLPDGSLNYGDPTYTGQKYLTYSYANSGDRKLYAEAGFTYNRQFGKHSVSGLALYNQSDNLNPFAGSFTLSIPYRTLGVAGRTTYSYDDRFFAEVNIGYNGSENFAADRRFGFFPAFGAGWIISNEKFFEPLKNTFQLLKFRYSDGKVGSGGSTSGYATTDDQRFYYLTQVSSSQPGYTFGQTRGQTFPGINVTAYGVNVTWSTTRKQDLGMELRTLNNNLSVVVDLFKEHRTDIFLQRGAVPDYIGLTTDPYGNLGIVNNKGVDATLEYNTKLGDRLHLTLRANYTYNKDIVVENDQAPVKYSYQELRGHNILARMGYIAEGLFTSQDEINKSAVFGSRAAILPGDIKYKDLNGDGVIDAYDQTVIGHGDVPSAVYGFGFTLNYKNWDIGSFFQGQHHADIMLNGDAINPFTASGGLSNIYANATDRWTVSNPSQNVFYPRLSYGTNNNNFQPSTWWQRDISFLRLKTVDLGYTIKNGLKSIGVQNMRVYFTGYNLATFSKFKLWDPELASTNGTRYPLVSTYSVGFTVKF